MINDDYRECEKIIKAHSTSFYKAFRHLQEKNAKAVYAVYAFCRTADDLVDLDFDEKALAQFEQELQRFKNNDVPDRPLWRALHDVFQHFPMDSKPFEEMLAGQRKDLTFQTIVTFEELNEYCYLVAGTVGLMLLPILSKSRDESAKAIAVALGCAMQYTNILRDVGEDFLKGRVYIPRQLLEQFEYTTEDLHKGINDQRYKAIWEVMYSKAEKLYEKALSALCIFDKEAQFPVVLAIEYYRAILQKVRKAGYPIYKRVFVSKAEKLAIFMRAKSSYIKLSPCVEREIQNAEI